MFAYAQGSRAETVAKGLREVGYDAYTDAPPEGSLEQVRIGCFGAQADADGLVQDVRQRVALDALVVPLSENAAPTVCIERELGFIPPANWGLESSDPNQVTFWLAVDPDGGRRTITFDGERWRLGQDETPADRSPTDLGLLDTPGVGLPAASPPGLAATFRATRSRGLPLVRADLSGGSLLVTAGELLWRSARAAVVQQGTDVFALRLYRP